MISAKKMYIDEDGYPRAEFEFPYENLGRYLIDDVQNNPNVCRELIQDCDDIMNGRSENLDGVGNAHHLVISQDCVRVACEFSDDYPPCTLSTGEFRQILLAWLHLIDPDANEDPG